MIRSAASRFALALVAAALPLLVGGCGSKLYRAQAAFKSGDTVTAEKKIESFAKTTRTSRAERENQVIAHLELGSIKFERGLYEQSAAAFQYAADRMNELESDKEYKVTEEFESAIKNPAEITYRGTPYDKIMSATMMGLAYGMQGDFENARPAFVLAKFQQENAAAKRREILETAQESAAEDEALSNANSTASQNSSYTSGFFAGYDRVQSSFTDAVTGAFFLGQLLGSDDASEAAFFFNRVSDINPDNRYAAADRDLAGRVGSTPPDRTYVFFATGFAPFMVETPIAVPTPVGLFTTNFPVLIQDQSGFAQSLSILAGEQVYTAEEVTDLDKIVGADFNAELPLIITRHTASALTKSGISVGVNQSTRDLDVWTQLAIQLTTWTYQIWQNKADIRSWQTLPKHVMYASFDTPADGVIEIAASPTDTRSLEVSPRGVNIVYVRSLRPGIPVSVAAFNVGTENTAQVPVPETESRPESQPQTQPEDQPEIQPETQTEAQSATEAA